MIIFKLEQVKICYYKVTPSVVVEYLFFKCIAISIRFCDFLGPEMKKQINKKIILKTKKKKIKMRIRFR